MPKSEREKRLEKALKEIAAKLLFSRREHRLTGQLLSIIEKALKR